MTEGKRVLVAIGLAILLTVGCFGGIALLGYIFWLCMEHIEYISVALVFFLPILLIFLFSIAMYEHLGERK